MYEIDALEPESGGSALRPEVMPAAARRGRQQEAERRGRRGGGSSGRDGGAPRVIVGDQDRGIGGVGSGRRRLMKLARERVCATSAAWRCSKYQMARVIRVAREWGPMPGASRSAEAPRRGPLAKRSARFGSWRWSGRRRTQNDNHGRAAMGVPRVRAAMGVLQ